MQVSVGSGSSVFITVFVTMHLSSAVEKLCAAGVSGPDYLGARENGHFVRNGGFVTGRPTFSGLRHTVSFMRQRGLFGPQQPTLCRHRNRKRSVSPELA